MSLMNSEDINFSSGKSDEDYEVHISINEHFKLVTAASELDEIKEAMHYPECWDTVKYPTVLDVIKEVFKEADK